MFIGQPKWFQDCEPGELVRIADGTIRGFALVISANANGHADRVVFLPSARSFEVSNHEPIISYGKDFRLVEGLDDNSVGMTNMRDVGAMIVRNTAQAGPRVLLSYLDGGVIKFVNVANGRMVSYPETGGLSFTSWSVFVRRDFDDQWIEVASTNDVPRDRRSI